MKMDDAAKKIGKVMGEFKDKKLKSSSGQKVKSRDQAIAIALSEARSMPKRGQRTATNRSKK
jgi:Sec-independent protein translocase protein TatA